MMKTLQGGWRPLRHFLGPLSHASWQLSQFNLSPPKYFFLIPSPFCCLRTLYSPFSHIASWPTGWRARKKEADTSPCRLIVCQAWKQENLSLNKIPLRLKYEKGIFSPPLSNQNCLETLLVLLPRPEEVKNNEGEEGRQCLFLVETCVPPPSQWGAPGRRLSHQTDSETPKVPSVPPSLAGWLHIHDPSPWATLWHTQPPLWHSPQTPNKLRGRETGK